MFNTILNQENVKRFLQKITNGLVYHEKVFPNTICEEKMDDSYYPIFMGIDAIIKYMIIIQDMSFLDEYLTQVELLLRKVNNHNEIVSGVNKLLVNYCKLKLKLKNITDSENKEIILKYIYKNYIVDGYCFHSFPSIFKEEVLKNGLIVTNYNYELDSLKDINKVFQKYNLNQVFSKDLDIDQPYITVCDSPFMGCYYAYHSPYFLNEVCTDLVEKNKNYQLDSLFKKDYIRCKKNLSYFMKKENMSSSDMNQINNFFDKEWDLFHINESRPIMAVIKRSSLKNQYLEDIHNIIENSNDVDLIISVNKILEIKCNHLEIKDNILPQSFEIVYLPTLEELGFDVLEENKKQDNQVINEKDNINEYGNTTIVALLGVLLITIGMTITLIMLGRG